ncbi:MAG TPA: 2OG-Fe(II) oxygenase [Rhizomicrobium sp.]
MIDFEKLEQASGRHVPYSHVLAPGIVSQVARDGLQSDFPEIPRPGFFPLSEMDVKGAFSQLIEDMSGERFAKILGDKLGIDLAGRPRLITVRKWSAAKDGRIHNDGEAKLATALIYLNEDWQSSGKGCFRVLNGPTSMDDFACEAPPLFGTLIAFKRSENSWHGHPPFAGERRVVQMAYVRSEADVERKARRGRLSLFLKKLNVFQGQAA